ncbi:1-acyl-sn-glycerol-3-phosphate acyltransferase [Mycobacterium sp. SMC-4]|uniref:lysophospholipid acyltransferase family protein n=1 Tax=Mycobacterium sp. SMC-4 TaxID=2857059 RepID=UPI0021B45E7C|nr:lysophospholipid acyltransferase family protein [Mycobacterium sp. SMC-4]UXA17871.1 1-acyl-sn-glycerol-3-phosphate acyltransferase [Mycobacterium sp. SMC-4]
MEPVYRALESTASLLVAATGTRIDFRGLDHVPASGGAVVCINHTGYVDFLPAGLAVARRRRRLRFMLKAEMNEVPVVRWLIRHTGTILVDRQAGASAYVEAVRALRGGELVGVYPEATISRSFELKDFKTGAARMARDAEVPIVPLIVWGAQRIWTKDHPRALGRKRFDVTVAVGEPIAAHGTVEELLATLRRDMTELLHSAQADHHHPPGAFWVPHRLGGGAPTPQEAERRDADERARRARKRTDRP